MSEEFPLLKSSCQPATGKRTMATTTALPGLKHVPYCTQPLRQQTGPGSEEGRASQNGCQGGGGPVQEAVPQQEVDSEAVCSSLLTVKEIARMQSALLTDLDGLQPAQGIRVLAGLSLLLVQKPRILTLCTFSVPATNCISVVACPKS